MSGALHNVASGFVWLRTIGLLAMFVIVLINVVLTGGLGWFLHDPNPSKFAELINAPPEGEPSDARTITANTKSWFQPMCPNKCTAEPLDTCTAHNRKANLDPTANDFSSLQGCSQKKSWADCKDTDSKECRDMYGIVPSYWNEDRSRVYVKQNLTHICLTGMNLASDPLGSWQDCLIYKIEDEPSGRLSIALYGNLAFLVLLSLSFYVEYLFHTKMMHKGMVHLHHGDYHSNRSTHHLFNVLYHVIIGVFALMLGFITVDLQVNYNDEMSAKMIQEVTPENGAKFDPYDDENGCFVSDTGMLVWNSAMGLHKAKDSKTVNVDNVDEYTMIYIAFLLAFGFVYLISGILLAVLREDANIKYESIPMKSRTLGGVDCTDIVERLEGEIRTLKDKLMQCESNRDIYGINDNEDESDSYYLGSQVTHNKKKTRTTKTTLYF